VPKEIDNFLQKNVHNELVDSILLVSAPVSDDADYQELNELAVHNAIRPLVAFFNDAGMSYIITMSWGNSWLDDNSNDFTQMHLNVVAKPEPSEPWLEEDIMLFKLKFWDMLPIKSLTDSMNNLFSGN
jgi:hypothetical protein